MKKTNNGDQKPFQTGQIRKAIRVGLKNTYMKKIVTLIVIVFIVSLNVLFSQNKQTYTVNGTKYVYGESYTTTGYPKVERSASAKNIFLKSLGYSEVPAGYHVDHIIPLSQGGRDVPENMQLITIEQHKAQTASERSSSSSNFNYSAPSYNNNSTFNSFNYNSTPSYNSNGKTIYTGSRGGQYYINSNGNKTYIKK